MNLFQIYIARRKAKKIMKNMEKYPCGGESIDYLLKNDLKQSQTDRQYNYSILSIKSIPIFRYEFKQFNDDSKWVLYGCGKIVHIDNTKQMIDEIKSRLLL